MNKVITKVTNTKVDMPEMPKLSVPETPIVNFGDKPSPVSPEGLGSSIGNLFGEGWMWNLFVVTMIVLILAILGINIFLYLARGSDYIADVVETIGQYLPFSFQKTMHMSAVGTKVTADVAADALEDVGDIVGEGISVNRKDDEFKRRKYEKTRKNELNYERQSSLMDAIDKRDGGEITRLEDLEASNEEDDGSKKGKSGWCYIGTDRGFRSCMKVDETDKCMSGEIFPTRDVCVNPSLRV